MTDRDEPGERAGRGFPWGLRPSGDAHDRPASAPGGDESGEPSEAHGPQEQGPQEQDGSREPGSTGRPDEDAEPPFQDPAPTQAWTVPAENPAPTEAFTPPADDPAPTEAFTPPVEDPAPTEAMTLLADPSPTPAPAAPPSGPERRDDEPSALDALFGEDRFQEVAPGPDPHEAPFAGRAAREPAVASAPAAAPADPASLGRTQKILLAISGTFVAALALISLYLLGTRLPELLGPAPAVIPTGSATPTAESTDPVEPPAGPLPPGQYAWHELRGGECLEPFTDPWAERFTVVDCADPHTAQLTFRGSYLSDGDGAADPPPYPGLEQLQGGIADLCSAPGTVNFDVAREYRDAQIQGTYPATPEQWEADPSYSCFLTLQSGERFARDVAPEPAESP